MSLKTYPETPEEEAARINAESGDPEGITAEQVANNRRLNESLTSAFTGGGSGSLPTNPFAKFVSTVQESIAKEASTPSAVVSNQAAKTELDAKIAQLSGGFGSGLNGMTSDLKNGFSDLGAQASKFTSSLADAAGLKSLANNTSLLKADISSSLSKLTGGSLAGGLSQLAGAARKAAGNLNDILSFKRGLNLPSGAEVIKNQGSAIKLSPGSKDDWRVRIQAPWNVFESPLFERLSTTGGVVWPYLPNITLSTKANYTNVETIHSNYPYYAYKNSSIDEIQISGEFSAETETDAAYWIAATTFFKTATKMFFGQGENAGNPPIVCHLYGYGASIFDRIPIVITSFSVDLKDDVNYVKCNTFGTNTWVPVLSTISVNVVPVYSRNGLRKFNLKEYASGKMADADNVGYL